MTRHKMANHVTTNKYKVYYTFLKTFFVFFLCLLINPVLFPTKLFVTIRACLSIISASIVPFGDILCGSPTMYYSPSLLLASNSIINPFPCTKALDTYSSRAIKKGFFHFVSEYSSIRTGSGDLWIPSKVPPLSLFFLMDLNI